MSAPCSGACTPFCTVDDLCFPCSDISATAEDFESAITIASDILYYASGQQFPGSCLEVVRPCSADLYGGTYPVPYNLRYLSPGNSYGSPCGCNDRPQCGCSPFREVELGFTPITSIVEIHLCHSSNPDWPGTCVLDPSLYHIDNFHYLVRDKNPDGSRVNWPACSSMDPDNTSDGAFEVEFTYGLPVPEGGKHAAATLACEIFMACANPDDFEGQCRLPRNVVTIVRQGVTVAFQSIFAPQRGKPMQFGIPEVDMWLGSVNPHGLTSPCIVLSPDEPDAARRVNT